MTHMAPSPEPARHAQPVVTERPTPPVAPRFAQLTYTAYHREDGVGGWQVRDTRGEIAPEERSLTAWVPTRLDPRVVVPEYPTAEERARLPRWLTYGPAPVGKGWAYWHSVPAGIDSSGRPGNVFAHILLDRRPRDTEPPLRSSDLVEAACWQRPFGAAEVRRTGLDEVPEPPWASPLDASAVLAFLIELNRGRRKGVLAALLDAVAAALEPEGPAVVLLVDAASSAAWWIAGVTRLMSPATSRRTSWSTGPDTARVPSPRAVPVRPCLSVLVRAEVGEIESGTVVLDEGEDVDVGSLWRGRPHRTRAGSSIAVTAWSEIAQVVLDDAARAGRVLATADQCAALIGDDGLAPAWPLAMAVAISGDDLSDADREAGLVLSGPGPDLARAPELLAARRALLLGAVGPETADAWEAHREPDPNGRSGTARRDLAAVVYLERALDDAEWLIRPEGVPLPEPLPDQVPSDLAWRARAALGRVAAAPSGPGQALAALRLVDLVLGARLLDPGAGELASVVDTVLGPTLLDPMGGAALVREAGAPAARVVRTELLVPWLARHLPGSEREPGRRLSVEVLRWLHPDPLDPPPARMLGDRERRIDPILAELAAHVTALLPDPSVLRPTALRIALESPPEQAAARIAYLAQGTPLAAEDLAPLARSFGVVPLAPVLAPVLLTAGPSDALDMLLDLMRDAHEEPSDDPQWHRCVDLGRLRRFVREWSSESTGRADRYRDWILVFAVRHLPDAVVEPHPDLVRGVLASWVVALVINAPDGPVYGSKLRNWARSRLLTLARTPAPATCDRLREDLVAALERGRLSVVEVAATAQLAGPEPLGLPIPSSALNDLLAVGEPFGRHTETILDVLVRHGLDGLDHREVAEIADAVREEVDRRDPDRAGRAHDERDPYLTPWWEARGAPSVRRWWRPV